MSVETRYLALALRRAQPTPQGGPPDWTAPALGECCDRLADFSADHDLAPVAILSGRLVVVGRQVFASLLLCVQNTGCDWSAAREGWRGRLAFLARCAAAEAEGAA